MGRFIIDGGTPLFGRVRVSGSKNAALPVIFSTLTTHGISRIENVPDITDVRVAIDIIKEFGAACQLERGVLTVDTTSLAYTRPRDEYLTPIRASTYLLGATTARFGRGEIRSYGGCNFSHRPIDMHLDAIRAFGGAIDGCDIDCPTLTPTCLRFAKCSVGATVNALILAACTIGRSEIYGIAREPHILDLVTYLVSAGAKIDVDGDAAIVEGAHLHGGTVRIRGDMIEAGTYLAASLITGGAVAVSGVEREELEAFIAPLTASGVCSESDGVGIILRGSPKEPISVTTSPYPGFPTDLQPILAPILSVAGGSIRDTVWQGRFGYLSPLLDFGIHSRVVGDTAEIFPSEIHASQSTATDLRGGMALILAALGAEGKSIVGRGEYVLRGYERLTEKLGALGAEIEYRD